MTISEINSRNSKPTNATIQLANRVATMKPSATLAMAQKAREVAAQGRKVINLSLGEPDFDAPSFLKDSVKEAVDQNYSHYSPVPGFQDLREAIADKLARENHLNYRPEQIVVSTGAKQSVANMILSLINPGDEVILPAPYWVSYFDVIAFAGGKPVVIPTSIETDFKVTAKQVQEAITPKTKLFLFSNPCNPSGTVYSEQELREVMKPLESAEHVLIASDEIYEYIYFENKEPYFSTGRIESLANRTITINGLSKGMCVTGWRLGYLAAPTGLAKACGKIQGQFTSGANALVQRAAITACQKGRDGVKENVAAFRERRDFLLELAKNLPGVKFNRPQGAFYLFPNFSHYMGKKTQLNGKDLVIHDSESLALFLLETAGVAMTPGQAFGCPGHLRLSYAVGKQDLEAAVSLIAKALATLN